jgi:hypothetical protein
VAQAFWTCSLATVERLSATVPDAVGRFIPCEPKGSLAGKVVAGKIPKATGRPYRLLTEREYLSARRVQFINVICLLCVRSK